MQPNWGLRKTPVPRAGEKDGCPGHQIQSGICSLSGGNKSQESSLIAGKYKENSSTNEGERRKGSECFQLKISATKGHGHGGEESRASSWPLCQRAPSVFLAVLSAGITGGVAGTTEHLQSPPCPLCAEPHAIRKVLLLTQPEPHHHPWDPPVSPLGTPWAAEVMVVPCGITGLPCFHSSQSSLHPTNTVGQDNDASLRKEGHT